MSRDKLAPPTFSTVSERFGTPVASITLTGAVLLALIAFVPILEIAKLASAFQILVFALVNLAVVAFREGDAAYDPEFTSPLYPWIQVFGVVSGLVLLTQMGDLALWGAALITVASVVWYLVYVRSRVDRSGAASTAIRQQVTDSALTAVDGRSDAREVLVAFTKDVDESRERALVSLAADLVRPESGRVVTVRFDEIPDQAPLTDTAAVQSPADRSFERRISGYATEFDADIEAGEVVSHDNKHAIVNVARRRGVDTVVAEHEPLRLRSRLLGDPIDWVVRHAPCDVLLVDNLGYDDPKRVAVSGETLHSPHAVSVAETVAAANGGGITLWAPPGRSVPDDAVAAFQSDLADLLSTPVDTGSVLTDGGTGGPDLLVRQGGGHRLRDALLESRPAVPNPGCTTVTVHPPVDRQPSVLRRVATRLAF